jgi:hypothetical protein
VEIDKKAVELCGDKAGSDGYLGCYQMAYNVIKKELSGCLCFSVHLNCHLPMYLTIFAKP